MDRDIIAVVALEMPTGTGERRNCCDLAAYGYDIALELWGVFSCVCVCVFGMPVGPFPRHPTRKWATLGCYCGLSDG